MAIESDLTSAPVWQFRDAGALTSDAVAVPYALVMAGSGTNGTEDIVFQGYNDDGSTNTPVHFTIAPDLSAFAAGATNQIGWAERRIGALLHAERRGRHRIFGGMERGGYREQRHGLPG